MLRVYRRVCWRSSHTPTIDPPGMSSPSAPSSSGIVITSIGGRAMFPMPNGISAYLSSIVAPPFGPRRARQSTGVKLSTSPVEGTVGGK